MIFRRRVPIFAGLVAIIGLIVALFAPLPYVIIKPGPTQNVLGSTITIKNTQVFQRPGALFSTTVLVSNPEAKMYGVELLVNWIEGDSVVLPRSAVYPKSENNAKALQVGKQEMVTSESSAIAAALVLYKVHHPERPISVKAADVSISLKDTGGPSAGLIFALGLLSRLDPHDFIHGRSIAGTGTIDSAGNVGPIGGIDQKMIGAARAGAKIFLMPQRNCADVTRVPKGLRAVPVQTLFQALELLQANSSEKYPVCPTR